MLDKFKEIQEKNPNLSSAMCFSKLVKGRKMSKNEISKWMLQLVEKEDWVGSPKEELVGFYWRYSNNIK